MEPVLSRREVAACFSPDFASIHRAGSARTGERVIATVSETAQRRRSGLPIGTCQRGVGA